MGVTVGTGFLGTGDGGLTMSESILVRGGES
mgnify:CR=1 FL=1